MDSRIAILGANGTGKSTLLNLITGILQPVEGTISKHANLKLSKYSQHSADQLPYEVSPLEYFQRLFAERFPEKDVQVRRFFPRFGVFYSFPTRRGAHNLVDSASQVPIRHRPSDIFLMVCATGMFGDPKIFTKG
jgi:energy-coupling factor transporter ATP-binding protein EcfA2